MNFKLINFLLLFIFCTASCKEHPTRKTNFARETIENTIMKVGREFKTKGAIGESNLTFVSSFSRNEIKVITDEKEFVIADYTYKKIAPDIGIIVQVYKENSNEAGPTTVILKFETENSGQYHAIIATNKFPITGGNFELISSNKK